MPLSEESNAAVECFLHGKAFFYIRKWKLPFHIEDFSACNYTF